jgi:hypothetical protein
VKLLALAALLAALVILARRERPVTAREGWIEPPDYRGVQWEG